MKKAKGPILPKPRLAPTAPVIVETAAGQNILALPGAASLPIVEVSQTPQPAPARPRPKLEDMVKDQPEAKPEEIVQVLGTHVMRLTQYVREVNAPVPAGLAEMDLAAVKLARMEKYAKATYLQGQTLGVALMARQARFITFEQYAQHAMAVEQLFNG